MDIAAFKELTRRVLEVTDELGLHREAVTIPLDREGDGVVRLATPEKIEIVGPEEPYLDAFIDALPGRLRALDLERVPRADPT